MENIPQGYCHCGCGQKTNISQLNRPQQGHIKGQPMKFLKGHHSRISNKPQDRALPEDRGYDTRCWIWQGAFNGNGYGVLRWQNRKQYAHRVIFELEIGEILEGMDIDHLCRVRECVNPQHLEVVSRAENLRRGRLCR